MKPNALGLIRIVAAMAYASAGGVEVATTRV